MQTDDGELGARIAAHRRRRHLTQEQLAGLVGISLSLMKKIESGTRPVAKFSTLVLLAQALRLRDMRELTGVPLQMAAEDKHVHPMAGDVRAALTEYSTESRRPPPLVVLERTIEKAWDAWQTSTPWRYNVVGQCLPALIRDAESAVRTSSGKDRRRALRASSSLYQLVRTWTKRAGEHELSWLAADRAMRAAVESDDPDLTGAGAWNLAMILAARDHAEEAMGTARRAVEHLTSVSGDVTSERLAVRGGLHLLAAVEAARCGRPAEAEDLLGQATPVAGRVGETNHHRMVFGPTNVALHRLTTYVELGRVQDALTVAEGISLLAMAAVERRLTYYLDSARCYTATKNDVAAIHVLQRLHRESPEELYFNAVARGILRELRQRAKPASRADLDPLLAAAGVQA